MNSAGTSRSNSKRIYSPPNQRQVVNAAVAILSDISTFSKGVIRLPLYQYQVEALAAVLDSVLNRKGLEFLLVFPRQSGKNEAVAQLLVYLMTLLQRVEGNIVYTALGDGIGRGVFRFQPGRAPLTDVGGACAA